MIAPILEKNCTGCHGAEKCKGDLRLHTVEGIKAGGKGGPVVVAGDPGKSPLCLRVSLAHDHDDIMPPGDKPKLSPADIKRIAWWIQDGAAFDKPYDEKAVPADIKPAA
ncbi:MAG: c-type cytochrome domain-containing protein [Kiritimatiellia bacterium]